LSSSSEKGLKTTLSGIISNLVLAVIKGGAGYWGSSYALIADAIESLSDVFTSMVVYFGIKVATKAPNKRFPYGHGKAEPVAGAVVGLILIGAAVFIIYSSIINAFTPHETPSVYTLYILILVVVVKELLFRYVIRVGTETNSVAVQADAWHHRSDAITSLAAFVGILIAIIGGPGYESADDWAACFASLIIIYNAVRILKPAISEIMDAAPSEELVLEVRKLASSVEGVLGLDKVFIRKMGYEYYVDMHVVVDGKISVRQGHEIAHKVKDEILVKRPQVTNVFVHIEPFDPDFDVKNS